MKSGFFSHSPSSDHCSFLVHVLYVYVLYCMYMYCIVWGGMMRNVIYIYSWDRRGHHIHKEEHENNKMMRWCDRRCVSNFQTGCAGKQFVTENSTKHITNTFPDNKHTPVRITLDRFMLHSQPTYHHTWQCRLPHDKRDFCRRRQMWWAGTGRTGGDGIERTWYNCAWYEYQYVCIVCIMKCEIRGVNTECNKKCDAAISKKVT